MATLASFLSFSLPHPHPPPSSLSLRLLPSVPSHASFLHNRRILRGIRPPRTVVLAFSASSFNYHCSRDENFSKKKSVLLNMIQDIEPLDISIIQRDVPLATLDAMKRTISGMLGLLPSDRFQVLIEALWKPLSKLLVSSMMTGYTLRNAEYRLSLEKNFDMDEVRNGTIKTADSTFGVPRMLLDCESRSLLSREDEMPKYVNTSESMSETVGVEGLGDITPEALQYILKLKSRLSSVRKELHEVKRKSAALQMQQFVGEEKNDVLDYLRSLQPEKVAELSEPTCPELKEAIFFVVHGLLATLSPKMHSKVPMPENNSNGAVNAGSKGDPFDVLENASDLQYQPLISLTRDYLARLLFWCMLLGHHLRGLEYRMELTGLLSLPSNEENYPCDGGRAA